jgi:pyridoxal phosphate enzyme (YggS family)
VDAIRLRAELEKRLLAVEERIQAACIRSGRDRSAVTLVAVTKSVPDEVVQLLPELGLGQLQLHLGENRPQQLWRRAALLPPFIHWHLIGHLQRNKIARTLPLVELIHSADRFTLLEALEEEAGKLGRPVLQVLLEVNTSREASKQGFAPEEVLDLAPRLRGLKHVQVCGLMTMAALEENPERCRPCFVLLRQLRDRLGPKLEGEHKLEHLSMGMSNDFEVAIEEGATLVRIGTALFEGTGMLGEPGA